MSSNNSNSGGNSNRNGFIFPDFSLRRLLLQTRTGRTPYTTRMCDVERGNASNSNNGGVVTNGIGNITNNKHEKSSHGSTLNNTNDVSSSKVSSVFIIYDNIWFFPSFSCIATPSIATCMLSTFLNGLVLYSRIP